MLQPKMNPDEIDLDHATVARLIATQFPRWAGLRITAVPSAGTDNAIYRLGAHMAQGPSLARVPRWHRRR